MKGILKEKNSAQTAVSVEGVVGWAGRALMGAVAQSNGMRRQ